MADIEKRIADLSLAKQTLLARRRAQGSASKLIAPRQHRGPAPLSFSQQRLWLIHELRPDSHLYNVPRFLQITGQLNLPALEASLNEIVRRHEILRTTFHAESGQPVQTILSELAIPLPVADLSQSADEDKAAATLRLALEEYRRPFDLVRGPLIRAKVWRLNDEEHHLLLVMHHIVSDGWTGGILFEELEAHYRAFAAGQASLLPDLPIQYADFASWQRDWMQGALEKELAYWWDKLTGAPATLDLPTDRHRPEAGSFRGQVSSLLLSSSLSQQVGGFAQTRGMTLFPVVLAALKILLFRWTGEHDLVIGTVSANRNSTEVEKLIGCFMNFLALRDKVEGTDSALALVTKVKETVLEAFAHQDCPFEKVVEALNPQRALNVNPLYNVSLLLQNYPEFAFRGDGLEARFLPFETEVAFLDLRFILTETRDGILLECEYNADLFDRSTADLLLTGYRNVLQQMIEQPTLEIANYQIPEGLFQQAEEKSRQQPMIAIAATFTAEPIQEPLDFWMKHLGVPTSIKFTPYDQVFQQLLDPSSLLSTNRHGANVVLLRIEDLQSFHSADPEQAGQLEVNICELVSAIQAAAQRSKAPYLICACPPSAAVRANADSAKYCEQGEISLASGLNHSPGVQFITSAELARLYPVADYDDEYAWKLGHIPYTAAMFAGMATLVARLMYDIRTAQHQVIVLSCDDTLWKGSSGARVELDQSHAALQDFMIAQQDAGRLLCLCSRTSEADVTSTFEAHPEMPLQWEHIVASRFGQPISDSVKELAEELGLGLDSFIYVDADVVACADMRDKHPEVLVAMLPAEGVPDFLRHFWAFDNFPLQRSASDTPANQRISATSVSTEILGHVASSLSTVPDILHAIESQRVLRKEAEGAYVAPRSPVEELLADIWTQLLRVKRPGIHDNFFALGGHSLLAVQFVARVRQALGVEMPLRSVFNAPTISRFAEQIEVSRGDRYSLSIPQLLPASRESDPPLSFAQQRMWFIDQLEPGNPLYNISQMYRMRGALQSDALEKAINEIVRRHESLRTSFSSIDGQPVQIIAPELRIPLQLVALDALSTEAREAELLRLSHDRASQPFDLANGPLFRTTLLKLGQEEHVLLLTLHHIVGDGWTGNLLATELVTLYEAFSQGLSSPLPALTIQYADFAVWQRDWLQGEILDKQVAYWSKQLAGAPAVLELPTDRPRPAVQRHRGTMRTHTISQDLVNRLRILSQAEGATLFMTLLAGFQVLLSRYSGQQDIVVGSPVAGRNYTEIEPLIGFFINTLALRTDLSGEPTFNELLARVKQVALDAFAHQEIPFERLVEELRPERSLSYNPIFQVLFGLQTLGKHEFELPGLRVERAAAHPATSLFDLSWLAFETSDGLLLHVEYDTDLFDDSTIDRTVRHFEKLLEGIATQPGGLISNLPLMGDEEQHQILIEFNNTAEDFPKNDLLHDFVARQTELTPHKIALVCGEERISYRELNERANQVAHYLIKYGAGPDRLIGIHAQRSAEMLIGILGVLKSGSAYVPLDPNYPKQRINDILQDADASMVLTQQPIEAELQGYAGRKICLDTDWGAISEESTENPITSATSRHLAYVLFTSGSTGRPKGVAIEHRSAATFIHWALGAFTSNELSGVLFSTSMCFDLSVYEMFVPLSMGGKVIMADNALYLPTLPARNEVTLINTVPSAIAELVRVGGVPDSVNTVNLAGEALPDALVEQIYANTSTERVYNLYGPTEDTTYSTYTLVLRGTPVTVGRPISNSQAYILDARLQPVPVGVPGELYLAGDGLARGYYGRPDLTAERFVLNPFSQEPGARMYRTGDLTRFLPDGNIVYLGRIDHQVKVRGFRIELGEIETALDSHPRVRQSIVMAREDKPGDKRLVAYIVIEPNDGSSEQKADEEAKHGDIVSVLRHWLAEKLPEFMIPSAFVLLDRMPLSANGKINRRELPAPEFSRDDFTVYVEPRTPVEQRLAAIWAQILGVPQVGTHDNFFALGGHSLLATQVISRIRQSVGVELPLRYIFEWPTIADLAVKLQEMTTDGSVVLPPIRPAQRNEAPPLSFAQQRLWFLNQLEPDNPIYNVPLAIRLRGIIHNDPLKRALNEIVRRHEILRTTYVLQDDLPVQRIADELKVEVPLEDLSNLPAETQDKAVVQLAIDNSRQTFNLQTGPLFRANLLKLADQDHVLLLNAHHIVTDGWSIWKFVKELAALYDAFLDGKPSPLPELTVQYADYAVWQRSWLQDEALDKQLSYWRRQLDGASSTLELPTDRIRPVNQSYRGSTEKKIYSRSLTDKLHSLSRREGVTLFMTLMAAYQTLLFRYSGQEDITVGSPVANRIHSEIEDLIGFFVNSVVIRSDLSGNPSFLELLQRVRTTALGAYSNQDLPFERLVEELRPERDLGRTPLFQVWFALQNAPRTSFQLPGIEITAMDVHNGTSKFDLGLFIVEKPEGLVCSVEYSTDIFDAATIQSVLRHLQVLLEAIVEDPDQRIGELHLVTGEERKNILVGYNNTYTDYPRDRSLHEFIEQQVELTPEATALVFESERLSYQELNSRANQLAHRLRKLGVGPDVLVGICAERSMEMVIGLLGIIKAGGAYVPLDPEYPRDRLAAMLADAEPAVLLTMKNLLDVLPDQSITSICLDRDWHTLLGEPTSNPPVITTGKDQAYVIYTSGSTGKPKGVPNVHAGIVNRLLWMQAAYDLNASDRVLQKTPYSFDVSVWEFFWPLMTGACLVIARPQGHKDPNYIADLIVEHGITTTHFVPSMLRVFLESADVSNCTSLRRVICSGEALPYELQQRFFEQCNAELHNLYGPTEASVDVTYWQCTPDIDRSTVPIGRPIWNTQIYILDRYMQPVPFGVAGELHIGGVGLARGYLKKPEMTAEKFISDPFSQQPGARLYKTGDLARLLRDGSIEYLGRIDHQVKIRGFRIELGEIETTLDSHPGVRQSVVMAREDEPGDKRLVAYIAPDPDYRGSDEAEPEALLSTEQVSQWTEAFDEAYRRSDGVAEATFNITGWDSSYTGKPIPAEEMRVWVESTVDRIRDLHPSSIWEIGCGTGLLLFRLAPGCERYYGTDISQTALDFLQQRLNRPELRLPQLTLARKAAHEFDGEPEKGQFDAVVMNSVIQYFPDLEYFINVLDGAVNSVRPGGAVFIGDVRSFALLEAFHTSVQLFQAPDALTRAELLQRIQKGIRQEGELLIDPEFFTVLHRRFPQINHVELQLKRGRAHNELTRFRYDVVLHIGEAAAHKTECTWLDWKRQALTPEVLGEILRKTEPEMLGLAGVPNARLHSEAAALGLLASDACPASVGELRELLQASPSSAVEPEDLWSIEKVHPYRFEIRASKGPVDGCFDIVLRRTDSNGRIAHYEIPRFPGEIDFLRPWTTYANNPLRQKVVSKLVPQLRLWVGAKLPEYMVPSAFVLLDSIPLSSNGKVNRRALPAPDKERPEDKSSYTTPQTPTEEIVAAIFADVLRVEHVGTQDDFFELGGHSLSATQVVSRVRQSFRVDMKVRALFESPTITALSRTIEHMMRGGNGLIAPPIVPVPRGPTLPLSFAQQRLWVQDQIEPNNPLYNIPRALRLRGLLNIQALESALNGIVQRHEVLRTTYGSNDGGHAFQIISPELKIPLPVVDLSDLPITEREKEARRIAQSEAATPFNLAGDPMTRNLLLQMNDEDHILLMITHHIASDGWSTGILSRELSALYVAALNGTPSVLPALPIQYADFAVWQRNWLQGEVLEQQLIYWRTRLDGAPPLLALPSDRPRSTSPAFRGVMHNFLLPQDLVDAIRALGRQRSATAFMTLLAAFECMILYFTRDPDIVLGTDLANRTNIQTEGLIGFFVNLLVLRTDLSGNPTFEELLGRVREVALGAYAHQDVPFDKLVEELQPERSISYHPLVQVLFVQQNAPQISSLIPGVEVSPYMLDVPSKFDMAIFVSETDKGISGIWLYNPDLFDATTIARMSNLYQLALKSVTDNPTMHLNNLMQLLAETEQQERATLSKEFQEISLQKLKNFKRKAITLN